MKINTIKIDQNFDNVLFLGDIHGDFFHISAYLKSKDLTNTLIIQVGDFGVGFDLKKEEKQLKYLNETFLMPKKNKVFVVRGNHDNPTFFTNVNLGAAPNYPNLKFIPDYTILEIKVEEAPRRILCIGGAVSIDREYKKKRNNSYWPEEVLQEAPLEVLNEIQDIDTIVTHTAPRWTPPYVFHSIVNEFAQRDPTLITDLEAERDLITKMMNIIFENNKGTLISYYYGHFHLSNTMYHEGVKMRGLAIDEFSN